MNLDPRPSNAKLVTVESLEISPQEAQKMLGDKDSAAVLIDVREREEFSLAHVEGARLLPMQSIPAEFQTLESLSDDSTLLILCHHGVRSLQVASWLRARGLESCYSIAGGIDRWSRELNPLIPRY